LGLLLEYLQRSYSKTLLSLITLCFRLLFSLTLEASLMHNAGWKN
jgi:hypothetical protein